jgi:ribosome-binding ATPase YchF (GTP1/OBG family)
MVCGLYSCLSASIINNPRHVRLPKIKAWVDEHNPGDLIIPFSVALEERLVSMSDEERAEEEKKIGATSALGKITQAGYAGLEVRPCLVLYLLALTHLAAHSLLYLWS